MAGGVEGGEEEGEGVGVEGEEEAAEFVAVEAGGEGEPVMEEVEGVVVVEDGHVLPLCLH